MASITRSGANWRAQVRIAGARPLSKNFPTRQEAARWAREQEGVIARSASPDPSRVTIADVIDAYRSASVASIPVNRAAVYVALHRTIGHVRVSALAPPLLIDHAVKRSRAGAGPPTVLMELNLLRGVLRQGLVAMGLPSAPVLGAISDTITHLRHIGLASSSRERNRRVDPSELEALRAVWSAPSRLTLPMWTLTCFAISTAMRLGEITRITWETFDPATRTILIPSRKHPSQKNMNDQRVPLLTFTSICGEVVDPVALMGKPARGRVFPYVGDSVSCAFRLACAQCGIEDLCFHDLRHEGVSRLFEAGFDIPRVALVSGHRSWASLKRYTSIRPESLHEFPLRFDKSGLTSR